MELQSENSVSEGGPGRKDDEERKEEEKETRLKRKHEEEETSPAKRQVRKLTRVSLVQSLSVFLISWSPSPRLRITVRKWRVTTTVYRKLVSPLGVGAEFSSWETSTTGWRASSSVRSSSWSCFFNSPLIYDIIFNSLTSSLTLFLPDRWDPGAGEGGGA